VRQLQVWQQQAQQLQCGSACWLLAGKVKLVKVTVQLLVADLAEHVQQMLC
jgi:hypothetical protein